MAIFRKVHVTFWKDSFIESLTPEQKYFYLYLITNENTKQCGIYEITIRQMCYDTGYNDDTIKKLLDFFFNCKKVRYSADTKEIAIKNWGKYNDSTSPKVKACITRELKDVKDRVLIQYVYSMDTHTQEEGEQEQNKEEEQKPVLPIKNKNQFPTDASDLPQIKVDSVKQLLKITKGFDVTDENILGMYAVFKTQNLTGDKFYANDSDIHSHFINWVKTQNFTNGKDVHKNNLALKPTPSELRALEILTKVK